MTDGRKFRCNTGRQGCRRRASIDQNLGSTLVVPIAKALETRNFLRFTGYEILWSTLRFPVRASHRPGKRALAPTRSLNWKGTCMCVHLPGQHLQVLGKAIALADPRALLGISGEIYPKEEADTPKNRPISAQCVEQSGVHREAGGSHGFSSSTATGCTLEQILTMRTPD